MLGGAALGTGLGQYSAQVPGHAPQRCSEICLLGPQNKLAPLAQWSERPACNCERVRELVQGFESCCQHNPKLRPQPCTQAQRSRKIRPISEKISQTIMAKTQEGKEGHETGRWWWWWWGWGLILLLIMLILFII